MISKTRLKELLPHGAFKKVADKAGVSPTAVTRYFDGKTKTSSAIYKAALQVAMENKEETVELEKRFSSLCPS